MSEPNSKSSRSRRSSILKVRQTVVESTVDVVKQSKNRRRVSFHHEKAVKQYDKNSHDLSASSPIKEAMVEAMSDFDSTKSNSTMMSLATPDRTVGDNAQAMSLFRGMMSGSQPSSVHHETKDMSFSIIEDPAEDGQNDTLNVFGGAGGSSSNASHVHIHSKTVDISYRMEEESMMNETVAADNTMDIFGAAARNQSTRTLPNMTMMDMDISRAGGDETMTERADGVDDTLGMFGSRGDTTATGGPLDSTMSVFAPAAISGSSASSSSQESTTLRNDESAMDITQAITQPSQDASQDATMALFGHANKADETVAMDVSTAAEAATPPHSSLPAPHSATTTIVEQEASSSNRSPALLNQSVRMDETLSPALNDTLAVFGGGAAGKESSPETGGEEDDDVSMDMEMTQQTTPPGAAAAAAAATYSSQKDDDPPVSPTINVFKKAREEADETMDVFGGASKRLDLSLGESGGEAAAVSSSQQSTQSSSQSSSQSSQGSAAGQKSMYEVDATMNVFGHKGGDENLDESAAMEMEEKTERSMMEISARSPVNPAEESAMVLTAMERTANETFNVFPKAELSQMDISGDAANATFDVVKTAGCNTTRMDVSGGNETLGVFGAAKTEEEEEEEAAGDEKDATVREEEQEEAEESKAVLEKSALATALDATNEGSMEAEEATPPPPSQPSPPYETESKKKRLSTVIEVSSRYTAASSQSMRQRVESAEEESGDHQRGILDGMEERAEGEQMEEEEEESKEGTEEETAADERSSMMEESLEQPTSPTANNTTFSISFTKKSMLDETRLSDRSMANPARTLEDAMLEKVDWMMGGPKEGGVREVEEVVAAQRERCIQEAAQATARSEAAAAELLDQVREERGELLANSLIKLNPSKVKEYRDLFEWARREAQREWWEKRASMAAQLAGEMEARLARDEPALAKADDDVIMQNRLNELQADVDELRAEAAIFRGLSVAQLEEVIVGGKRKAEERSRLQRELDRRQLESMAHSTTAIQLLIQSGAAMDAELKRKMEQREKHKKDLRAYLNQLSHE